MTRPLASIRPHPLTRCTEVDARYSGSTVRVGGRWYRLFDCPVCHRRTRQNSNFLGQRVVLCDGRRFHILTPDQIPAPAPAPEGGAQ